MEILIKAVQLILSLSILVILHELGHFLPAKYFKTKVEKFYLFFDPWFSLFKKKVGDTEYGVGWLPLGGYVKIAGMIDESMDKEQMKKPAEPWEFRAKPAWQRLIIMLGGVVVNLLLGFLIYSMTLYAYGDKYLPNSSLTDGVWCIDKRSRDLGFLSGDKILSIDDEKVKQYRLIVKKMLVAKTVTIEREGRVLSLSVPDNFIEILKQNEKSPLFYPRVPSIIKNVIKSSNAELAGLKTKDQIISINDEKIQYHDEIEGALSLFKDSVVNITVLREGQEISLKTKVDLDVKIGYFPNILSLDEIEEYGVYAMNYETYSFFGSFPAGLNKAVDELSDYIKQFGLILNPNKGAIKEIGGFAAIGGLFPSKWDWERFWNLTAFLSLMLAFLNILPIPALDGGHVVFLFYEMVVGKPAPEKFMESAQIVGMLILLVLVVYANLNDFGFWGN